ncbi:MAG TPA: UDP-N-acetylglucosamine 1-carboxyvinyltransferase [Pseudobdellovibrionaceae bacterium]|nr:UDP-N-acetylglucosamine 1-carboxyvinyltransferase [Pseudobdellovibrionaceae bacterium]
MDRMIVQGGSTLQGEVSVSGSKNAALPILFSSLLAPGDHVFENVPQLHDISSTGLLLESLGCKVNQEHDIYKINVPEKLNIEAHYDLVRKMRASFLCMGPLLARMGTAVVSQPGGCAIGSRPIDLHLDAFRALGAEIENKEGYVHAHSSALKGNTFLFETVTVGGTENLLMAAVLAQGKTIIENAAKEPEVVDLADYLIKMGAKIKGHGTSIIEIEGVTRLKPAVHRIIPDRIEAGTLLLAGAITKSELTVKNCIPEHLESFLLKLKESGLQVSTQKNSMTIHPSPTWKAVDITTAPYPLFPTDLQAQFMSLMTLAEGTSIVAETIFENRFMHVGELIRLGADINPKSRVAVIRGRKNCLTGAPVMATDLRASACLILAGLAAQGETTVSRIYHLDRGYEKLELKLSALGAKIKRVK